MWFKLSATGNTGMFYGQNQYGDNYATLYIDATNKIKYNVYTATTPLAVYSYTWAAADTNWHALALVRNGTDLRLYIDGTYTAWTTVTTAISTQSIGPYAAVMDIGGSASAVWSGYDFTGTLDELRFTKGTARYTGASYTLQTTEFGGSIPSGYLHTLVYPMPIVPSHLGVVVKMDSAFTSNQHQYLRVEVSRDGTNWTDCHPITKIGTAGYYRAAMSDVNTSIAQHSAVAKISLSGSTDKKLQGYGIYGE